MASAQATRLAQEPLASGELAVPERPKSVQSESKQKQ